MRLICVVSWVWVIVISGMMWFPTPHFAEIALTFYMVQVASFTLCAILFALSSPISLESFLPMCNHQRFVSYVNRFKRHFVRLSLMLLAYAAILEICKYFLSGHARVSQFGENELWILLASGLAYLVARVLFSWIIRHHLRPAIASFRIEMAYSGALRDVIQAGYAICVAQSAPTADKVEQIRRLLDAALGLDVPKHSEELLDIAYGPRKGVPARFRTIDEAAGQPKLEAPRPKAHSATG